MTFDLDRFLDAQADVYEHVVEELRRGRKTSHWMWFVFPQLRGLGRSSTATFYGLDGAAGARAYLEHPVLGERLNHCTTTVTSHDADATAIFGSVDAMKFRSSLTLFDAVGGSSTVFRAALDHFFEGEADELTLDMLNREAQRD